MTPIIDPWLVYWISVLDAIRPALCALVLLSGFVFGLVSMVKWLDESNSVIMNRVILLSGMLLVISSIGACLTPKSNTVRQMIAAKNASQEMVGSVWVLSSGSNTWSNGGADVAEESEGTE